MDLRSSSSLEALLLSQSQRNSVLSPPASESDPSSPCRVSFLVHDQGSLDLTQPFTSSFLSPPLATDADTSTPLVRASPAIGAFPFPRQANNNPLTPPCSPTRVPLSLCRTPGYPLSPPFTPTKKNRSPSRTASFSPDRFIPLRRSPTASTYSFHLSKPPHQLSDNERLLRRRAGSPDPFTTTSLGHRSRYGGTLPARIHRPVQNQWPGATQGVFGPRRVIASSLSRQASLGAVWNVGGVSGASSGGITAVSDGRGGLLGSGTNAPMYTSKFLNVDSPDQDLEKHEARLALALDFDQANRVLGFNNDSDEEDRSSLQCNRLLRRASTSIKPNRSYVDSRTIWKDNEWMIQGSHSLLDAPRLRDDFYCSLLAYSYTAHCLAVGLSNSVYLWSEKRGVQHFTPFATSFAYVTSLGFSSTGGRQSILAIGRADGQLSLWGLDSREAQFEALQPTSIACVAFQPNTTQRPSKDPACTTVIPTEGLLVGDEVGEVYYYSVEWPKDWSSGGWAGSLTVLARISVHTQQICGLSWSLDGEYFATGGNDNACCLFEVANTLGQGASIDDHTSQPMVEEYTDAAGETRNRQRVVLGQGQTIAINSGHEKHRWMHNAAVKAIAFCPWQRGLVATGGGSNDRCIHFYHTFSGACLATISVAAQVTSLIWSNTRREIAATFGYAQPEHPYRIAVFSWPDCQQVVAIPWSGEMRALYAIPYPGGPNERNPDGNGSEGGVWASRTSEEGCIVIASSDESVKFHEVWSEARRTTGGNKGLLGGSDILEELAGIDKEGSEVIR